MTVQSFIEAEKQAGHSVKRACDLLEVPRCCDQLQENTLLSSRRSSPSKTTVVCAVGCIVNDVKLLKAPNVRPRWIRSSKNPTPPPSLINARRRQPTSPQVGQSPLTGPEVIASDRTSQVGEEQQPSRRWMKLWWSRRNVGR